MNCADVFTDPSLISMSREAFGIYDAIGLLKVVATQKEAASFLTSHEGQFIIKKRAMRDFWMEILPELNVTYKN